MRKTFSTKVRLPKKKCWTITGCLITADRLDDNLIKPEGLPNFIVPPPSFLNVSDQTVTNSVVPEERH